MSNHTCINTQLTSDGSAPPPCKTCELIAMCEKAATCNKCDGTGRLMFDVPGRAGPLITFCTCQHGINASLVTFPSQLEFAPKSPLGKLSVTTYPPKNQLLVRLDGVLVTIDTQTGAVIVQHPNKTVEIQSNGTVEVRSS